MNNINRITNRWVGLALLIMLMPILGLMTGCGEQSTTMTVLAGSELKDIQPLLDEIKQNTGIELRFEYVGTLNGAEQLLAGEAYDIGWFSHAAYLNMLQQNKNLIATQEKVMLSPVIMAVKESKMKQFGWDSETVSWVDIAAKSASGELRYAMTNPTASNSGFTGLVSIATALCNCGDAVTAGDIAQVETDLADFFKGQKLTAGSSGWLAEQYIENEGTLDGIFNYESVILSLNENNQVRDRLVPLYPKEGVIRADYPIMLLNKDKRESFDKLTAYLLTDEFQEKLMGQTLRRPVNNNIAVDARLPQVNPFEIPFPATVEDVDALLFNYLDKQRVPSHAIFVLDTSGSMRGDGMRDLKAAMNNLTGVDSSLTGQFSRFRGREKVTIIPFEATVGELKTLTINDMDSGSADMQEVRNTVESLNATGGTALFTAIDYAYQFAAEAYAEDPTRYYSIVVMSDGQSTDGIDFNSFVQKYNQLSEDMQNVRAFTVLFGDADKDAMEEIAELTGGRMFDGTTESLSFIFKQIRGYQ